MFIEQIRKAIRLKVSACLWESLCGKRRPAERRRRVSTVDSAVLLEVVVSRGSTAGWRGWLALLAGQGGL